MEISVELMKEFVDEVGAKYSKNLSTAQDLNKNKNPFTNPMWNTLPPDYSIPAFIKWVEDTRDITASDQLRQKGTSDVQK